MVKYYTRACNFFYGNTSRLKIKKNNSLPLSGDPNISFDSIEIISRNSKKILNIKKIKNLNKQIKKKILNDIKKITQKKNLKILSLSIYQF